jgi:hypothetical protein
LDRTLKRDYASIAFRFLRHPSRPNPARPEAKSGSAAGSGTSLTVGDTTNEELLAVSIIVSLSIALTFF